MIWINVTTTMKWRGAMVGIVRTESEITKNLLKNSELEIGLFCFVEKKGFTKVRTDEFLNKIKGIEQSGDGSVKISPGKKLLISIFNKMPSNIQNVILKYWRLVKKHQMGCVPETDKAKFKTANSFFSPDDIVISLGLDWQSSIVRELGEIRKFGSKVVLFCYDIIPLIFPEIYGNQKFYKKYYLSLAENADLVIADSHCAERDFLKLLSDNNYQKVETNVIVLGTTFPRVTTSTNVSKVQIRENIKEITNKRFILYVSSVGDRKNHEIICKAYENIIKQDGLSELPIAVFVGRVSPRKQNFIDSVSNNPILKDKIVFAGECSDQELELLYRNCLFTVFPSIYEGWGLGVAESLAYGKIVLSSNTSSLTEVGNGFAVFLDPNDVGAWSTNILRYSNDSKLRSELEKKIKDDFKVVTWENTARQLEKIVIDSFCVNNRGTSNGE